VYGIVLLCRCFCIWGRPEQLHTTTSARYTDDHPGRPHSRTQQQANNGRHEARKEEMRLQFASDNFSLPENGLFRYRAIFTKPGEKSTVIDKTIDFT